MFEVKVSAVTRFADRVVGTRTGLAAVSATPTLCADAGDDVREAQEIGDDIANDIQSDIGDNILDAIGNFAEEATLVGAPETDAVGADGVPAEGVFPGSASVGELLRVRRAALAYVRNRS